MFNKSVFLICALLLTLAACQPLESPPNQLPTEVPLAPIRPPAFQSMRSSESVDRRWTYFLPIDWKEDDYPVISALFSAPNGMLWMATMGGADTSGRGVYRYDGMVWLHYTRESGLPSDDISAIQSDRSGAVWFASFCCGVSRFDGSTWKTYTVQNGLADNDVRSMAIAQDGALWFATAKGISRFDGNTWKSFCIEDGLPGNWTWLVGSLPDGTLLARSDEGKTSGTSCFNGSVWSSCPLLSDINDQIIVTALVSLSDTLWLASSKGVLRFRGSQWVTFWIDDGLPNSRVNALAIDTHGRVWVGTENGAAYFDGKAWVRITAQDGLRGSWVSAIAAGPNGSVWLATDKGINWQQDLLMDKLWMKAF